MELFNKKELDDNDKKKFPETYKRFNSIKHDKKEVNRMCEKIDSYAREKETNMCISMCIKFNQSRDEIISELTQRFNLTEEDADKYYNEAIQQ